MCSNKQTKKFSLSCKSLSIILSHRFILLFVVSFDKKYYFKLYNQHLLWAFFYCSFFSITIISLKLYNLKHYILIYAFFDSFFVRKKKLLFFLSLLNHRRLVREIFQKSIPLSLSLFFILYCFILSLILNWILLSLSFSLYFFNFATIII